MMIKIILTCFLFVAQLPSNKQKQSTGTITVQISGVEESKGILHISLYNSARGFPTSKESAVKTYRIEVVKGKQKFTIPEIPYGKYAISCFHDVNSNNKIDVNFLGIPKEKVGTSNNPLSIGIPSFEDATFQLNDSTINLQIQLN